MITRIIFMVCALIGSAGASEFSVDLIISPPDVINSESSTIYTIQNRGEPQVPFVSSRILLPCGERIESVLVELNEYIHLSDDTVIPPAKGPVPIAGNTPPIGPDPAIYSSNEPYPVRNGELVTAERLGGFHVAFINVYPYVYRPLSRRYGYYSRVTVHLKTIPDTELKTEQSLRISRNPAIMNRLSRLATDMRMLNTYPSVQSARPVRNLIDPEDPRRFLIITNETFKSVFEAYATWKEEQGISAAVYTTEEIYPESPGSDNPEKIRSFITEAYDAWSGSDQPLEFVLLGGDDEIIPVRGCWGYTSYFGTDYHIPCDLYYGALDGDWNANGNPYYGEIDDDPDLIPEVHVGRFTGDNLTNFENMIRKIQWYVETPWPNIYTTLMVGELLNTDPLFWGGDLCDEICDDPAYMPSAYYVTKMYDRDGTFSTTAVRDHINADGSALIYHVGHTHYYYLMGLNQYDIDNFTNTRYPFFSSGGCHTMAFDQATSGNAESVGEHALFSSTGMAGFLGNSRYGFSVWVDFIQILMQGIFTMDIPEIGASLSYSREQLIPYINNDLFRWEYYELNLAGDPEMHLIYDSPMMTELEAAQSGPNLILSWTPIPQATGIWVYGAPTNPYFIAGYSPAFDHRLIQLPGSAWSWTSPYPVGNPATNWYYLVMAVDDEGRELGRSNRAGEIDFETEISLFPHD